MKLTVPTKQDCEIVRQWRNDNLVSLRTPYELTTEMQEDFYGTVVCNPNSKNRYWSIYNGKKLIGFGGITNIQWENRIGEISLIITPERREKGYGLKAVDLLLDKAFHYLNLHTVCGECYFCNDKAIAFWQKITDKYRSKSSILDNRKFWDGDYWDGLYFTIGENEYGAVYCQEHDTRLE